MNAKACFGLAFTLFCFLSIMADGQNNVSETADGVSNISPENIQTADPEIGETLFKTYCTACHHMEMRLVGPALKDVRTRRAEDWIINFVQGSQGMIESGDSTAVALFAEFNKIVMPDQPVDDGQIRNILAYIESYGSVPSDNGNISRPRMETRSSVEPLKFSDFRFWITYTIMVILMIITFYYLIEYNSIS